MSTPSANRPDPRTRPVLHVTRYERVSAWVIALVFGLAFACGWLILVWITNRLPKAVDSVPVEILELPGGSPDGAPGESLRVDSPLPEINDPSPAEMDAPESEIQEVLENVVELSDIASNQARQQFELGTRNVGKAGSARGTGRRGYGVGPGKSGLPREQRWYIRFADQVSLDEYARQLDFFGIELAALLPEGKIVYLSNLSEPQPQVRHATSGKDEQRLYMTWQGGDRRVADLQLFKKAGVEVPLGSVIFHFYPPRTEAQLARLEREYQNRPANQIRRTYFTVEREGRGYRFVVLRQTYLPERSS